MICVHITGIYTQYSVTVSFPEIVLQYLWHVTSQISHWLKAKMSSRKTSHQKCKSDCVIMFWNVGRGLKYWIVVCFLHLSIKNNTTSIKLFSTYKREEKIKDFSDHE